MFSWLWGCIQPPILLLLHEAITTTWATSAQGTGLDSEGAKSSHFMDPSNTTDRGSQWQFEEALTIVLFKKPCTITTGMEYFQWSTQTWESLLLSSCVSMCSWRSGSNIEDNWLCSEEKWFQVIWIRILRWRMDCSLPADQRWIMESYIWINRGSKRTWY